MQVEIWSDIVCPWCYIGKRRLETALKDFEHAEEVEIVWRSFELDRSAPRERTGNYAEMLGRKYGMGPAQSRAAIANMTELAAGEGLVFDFDRVRPGNTFDAHRLLHLARERGRQDALKERLMLAYLTEGEPIGDPAVVGRMAVEVGLDATEVESVLDGDRYGDQVRADEQAAEELGVTGVPFFVVDRRYAVSGAQQPDTILRALERAWSASRPLEYVAAAGGGGRDGAAAAAARPQGCEDGSCDV